MINNIRLGINWEDEAYLHLSEEERLKFRALEEINRRWGSYENFLIECKVNVEKVKRPVIRLRVK